MHVEDSTFWAGSWPHARKSAVTRLDECALKPPIEPAIADPTKFLYVFTSTIAAGSTLSTERTSEAGMTASTATDLPRPSIQLTADGFLSVQKLPERASSCEPGKQLISSDTTVLTPLPTMFTAQRRMTR